MENDLYVSSSPHLTDKESIAKIMYSVVIALIPAAIGAIYFFGMRAAWAIIIAVAAAVAAEAAVQTLLKRKITIADGSAIVTGILLAFNVPANIPLWMPAVGSFFAIVVGKHAFGGLGYNPMNPALLGRAFLLASWPTSMTVFNVVPRGGTVSGINESIIAKYGINEITQATPLNVIKQARDALSQIDLDTATGVMHNNAVQALYDSYGNLFWGKVGGCLGETSVFLLLIGAIFLMYKRYIGWKIPFTYLGTVALLGWIFGGTDGIFSGKPFFHLFSGGVILGAFFMATDMVTSPVTFKGRLIFGTGCGVITMIIRQFGGYPEGVSYSILLMNLTTPLLDRYTKPKILGTKKK